MKKIEAKSWTTLLFGRTVSYVGGTWSIVSVNYPNGITLVCFSSEANSGHQPGELMETTIEDLAAHGKLS